MFRRIASLLSGIGRRTGNPSPHAYSRTLRLANPFARTDSRRSPVIFAEIFFAGLLVLWIASGYFRWLDASTLPSPLEIIGGFSSLSNPSTGPFASPISAPIFKAHGFSEHVLHTLVRIVAALSISIVLGVWLGAWVAMTRLPRRTVKIIIGLLAITPGTVLVGFLTMARVLDTAAAIMLASLFSFLYVWTATYNATHLESLGECIEIAQTDTGSKPVLATMVIFPHPDAITVMSVGLTGALWAAFRVVLFAEWALGSSGLGVLIRTTSDSGYVREFFAVVLTGYIVCLPLFFAAKLYERFASQLWLSIADLYLRSTTLLQCLKK